MDQAQRREGLAPLDVGSRLGRMVERFDDAQLNALVVTKLENIRYLTGFSGSAGTLVVRGDAATLITDGRYTDQSAAEIAAAGANVDIEIASGRSSLDVVAARLDAVKRVGLEADSCTWAQQRQFAERLPEAELVATSKLVEALRVVKDDGELARIERACGIANAALLAVRPRLRDGITEAIFAAELEFEMRKLGSDSAAFTTIVASGPNSARPHARPTHRPIAPGELVVVDFGATIDGYRSDMTRTLCAGEPTAELAAMVDAVFHTQRAGVEAVNEGVTCGAVDAACRELLTELGYGERFTHSTGHGVGLEIHEAPWVSSGSADILKANSVVTIEPGAYLSGQGGVRIEDTVVVTPKGARALTTATKDYLL